MHAVHGLLQRSIVCAFVGVVRHQRGQDVYRHAIFVEGLGSGGYYSINYERTIFKRVLLRGGFTAFSRETWFPLMAGFTWARVAVMSKFPAAPA